MNYKRIGIPKMRDGTKSLPLTLLIMKNKHSTPNCFHFFTTFASLVSILSIPLKTYLRGQQNFSVGKCHGLVSHVKILDSSASFNICNHLLLFGTFFLLIIPNVVWLCHTCDLWKSVESLWTCMKKWAMVKAQYVVYSWLLELDAQN